METSTGHLVDRLCPWSRYVQRSEDSKVYHSVFYHPSADQIHQFRYPQVKKRDRLKIYEAHVGISSAEEKISTYDHFRCHIIPRIAEQGISSTAYYR